METRCCYWIIKADVNQYYLKATLDKYLAGETKLPTNIFGKRIRRVSKGAWGSYAHIDRDKAWRHFDGRQRTRLHRIQMQLSQVEMALKFTSDKDKAPSTQSALTESDTQSRFLLGHNEFTENEVHWY
jgi:hypothetical protein